MKKRETVTGIKAALAGVTIAVFLGVTGLVTAYAQGAPGPTAFASVIRLVDLGGATVATSSFPNVNPGAGTNIAVAPAPSFLRCEFRVTGAPASSVRANMSVGQGSGTSASADAR